MYFYFISVESHFEYTIKTNTAFWGKSRETIISLPFVEMPSNL